MRKPAAAAVLGENLDALFALGRSPVTELRHDVFAILDSETGTPDDSLLHEMSDCAMHLPTSIRGFTDFFVGIHHAIRCGEIINGPHYQLDRKSVVKGKSGSVRVDLGGRRIIKKKKVTHI